LNATKSLLSCVLSLQPRQVIKGGKSRESVVLELIGQLLQPDQVPAELDLKTIKKNQDEKSALTTVLFQEIDRYNTLLSTITKSLKDLQKGIDGSVLISPELETVFESLFNNSVPEMWQTAYPSVKPLGSWIRDLNQRVQQLQKWVEEGQPPKVVNLSGFTYPIGFLTALLQNSARRNGVQIDTLAFDYVIMPQNEQAISTHLKDGAYVKGLFLEGARWDQETGCLAEPLPGELYCPMPIIHFKPVENKKKTGKGQYSCPLYMSPVRSGSIEKPSFVIEVDLKTGARDAQFWTKRGTALLLSLQE